MSIPKEAIDTALKVLTELATTGKTATTRQSALASLKRWEKRTGQKVYSNLVGKEPIE